MSLVTIPTVSIAATPAAPAAAAPTVVAPPANAWLSLSAMTANSSSAAAAATLQDDDGPGFPPIAPLVVILATIGVAIWILTKGDNDSNLDLPVSPD
jgi:hypothetical protein